MWSLGYTVYICRIYKHVAERYQFQRLPIDQTNKKAKAVRKPTQPMPCKPYHEQLQTQLCASCSD